MAESTNQEEGKD